MKIEKPEIVEDDGRYSYQVRVTSARGDHALRYRVERKFADLLSDSSDAALAALLIPAMAAGEDIHLAGPVSERLYYNLSGRYQKVLQAVIPSLRRVAVYPAELHSGGQRAPGVATGFSAGIDSFCVLADHYYGPVPAAMKVTHLLFNNVGSHGRNAAQLFRKRHAALAPFVDHLGLPYVLVDSNVDEFYLGRELDFQQTHTPRNASVALLLQGGIGRYMYASAFDYAWTFVGPAPAMGHADPVALPLLSTDILDAFSVGSEYTRVQKTLRVAELPDSYDMLEICARGKDAGNCSTCWKCLRTLLTLDIAGVADRYARVFDLNKYHEVRMDYMARVLRSHEPLEREIVKFAAQRGFPFPAGARLRNALGPAYSLFTLPRRAAGRLKRALSANAA